MFEKIKDRCLQVSVLGSTLLASSTSFAAGEPIDFATLAAPLADYVKTACAAGAVIGIVGIGAMLIWKYGKRFAK